MMLSHVSVSVSDLARSQGFYDAPLGYRRLWMSERGAGYGECGTDEPFAIFAVAAGAARSGPGFHLAFTATSRGAVDRFHAEALAAGGTDDGGPGVRPGYGKSYYAAVRPRPRLHQAGGRFSRASERHRVGKGLSE